MYLTLSKNTLQMVILVSYNFFLLFNTSTVNLEHMSIKCFSVVHLKCVKY